ncbi:MAG TPA: phosphate acyltransferase PlsX [Bacteroidota bacterium]|nr:phosphate acyltransferase PlsX [Bacteroidota bacterium]
MDSSKVKVVVDAMGGDYAPLNVIKGAFEALKLKSKQLELILVGNENKIIEELKRNNIDKNLFSIIDAPDTITMHDSATSAIKSKQNSSIVVGINLLKEKKADAFISAGNTGAVMTAATLILGRLKGISRPTIGATLPSQKGSVLLVDAGANVECKPNFLYEFAIMSSIFVENTQNIKNPSIGLLSIGEEKSKGNNLILETNALMRNSNLNFVGNVEGSDIFGGKCDVVICDGYTGNILLKFAEGFLPLLKNTIRNYSSKSIFHKLWSGLIAITLKKLLKKYDYQEHGGVPLLGVNGTVIIGHGKSTPKAIKNMIFAGVEMYKKDINKKIEDKIIENQNQKLK